MHSDNSQDVYIVHRASKSLGFIRKAEKMRRGVKAIYDLTAQVTTNKIVKLENNLKF